MTIVVSHPACVAHETPPGHPESPARLRQVLNTLKLEEFQSLDWVLAPKASRESLALAHTPALIDSILGHAPIAEREFVAMDPDTFMSPGTADAALRAAGAAIEAVDRIVAGEVKNAFCAVRPPGHHAGRDHAMGFCLFNNVAVGAMHARAAHGLNRVAVIDFDVHHGNGTQDIFWNDANLFYASTHQAPLYPGTGNADETGISCNIVNVPLAPNSDTKDFRDAMSEIVLPKLEIFAPEFIFISAGFDAHTADPLAQLELHEDDFEWATLKICEIASRCCDGRVVSSLEGGYDLGALARSAAAHVRALMEA